MLIYSAIGFGVWLSGAIEFRLAGKALFESGPWVTILVALCIAVSVCLVFQTTMRWMKANDAEAVTVAVVMALPGLFVEALRQLFFTWATGINPGNQPAFAATLFFGNGALLAYAVWRGRPLASRK